MSDKEIEEQNKKIEDFLKLAMCIDGEAKYAKKVDGILSADGKKLYGALYKLTDSIRGTFYISMLKPLE